VAAPTRGWPSHPPEDPPDASGQQPLASYSGPAPADPWQVPWGQPSSSSQLPGQAAVPLPATGHQMVPWQGWLTHIAINQLAQSTSLPPRDDDEDSHPSEEGADSTCYRKADHNYCPPPGPIKIRFTSANYKGKTRNVRVCEKCWRWIGKPTSGFQVVLRGSSRAVHV
jgi:hypothetical protein